MTPPVACWIVQEDDERWLAERTLRALGERGIAADIVTTPALPERLDATRPAWLLRAGALPDRLPALPARASGRGVVYLGVEVDDRGEMAPGWHALIAEYGGRLAPGTPGLPRWVIAFVEQPAALAQPLRQGHSIQQALAQACETQRAVVASGIRARWSAEVRVGLLIGTLHRGGAEQVTLDLASHLPSQGIATTLVTCFEPKRDALAPPAGTVCLYRQPDVRDDVIAGADRAFKRWGADLVHAHLVESRALRRLTAQGHCVATTVHNARAGWPAGHDALTRADAALVLGCAIDVTRALHSASVERTTAAPRPAIRTAWNGIAKPRPPAPGTRESVRRELAIAADALVIVSIANDRPQKRLHLLAPILDALDALRPGAACIQVGHRPDVRLPETLRTLPDREHPQLHHLGASGDIGRWLAAADVFVSTSAHEGLSLAQLEALAAGLPVVATAVGGHAELSRLSAGFVAVAAQASPATFADAIVAAARLPAPGIVDALSARRMAARHAALYRATVRARRGAGEGVLVISNNQFTGGAQSSARRFALALHAQGRRCGVAVLFETTDALSAGSREIASAGVPLFAPSLAQRTNARTLSDAVAEHVRRFAPSIVIFWNANVEVKIRVADALAGMALFDVSPGEMFFAELTRYFTKPASDLPYFEARDYGALLSGVVVKYADERDQALRLLERPVHVVPNGLLIPLHPQRSLAARGSVIGTLARINPDKKLEELIAAFERASVHRPELELLIGGAPDKGHAEYAEALRSASAHLRIRWLGHIEPAALFDRIALFVLVAEPAGCPNASLEAMAAGLAVLATRVGGMAEQVVEGATGWLTPRGDPTALAARLGDVLDDPAALDACGERARQRALARFSVERMVAGYLEATGLTAPALPANTPATPLESNHGL
ncbi:MAG: glycosyltransferase [Burkholderiaceae bacterium]